MPSEKIAITGGGVAGLTAGYLLRDLYDVTLFEKDNRLGGNVYTLRTKTGEEIDISVFFWSPLLYPNFRKLLERLGIKLTTMPFLIKAVAMSLRAAFPNVRLMISIGLKSPGSAAAATINAELPHRPKRHFYVFSGQVNLLNVFDRIPVQSRQFSDCRYRHMRSQSQNIFGQPFRICDVRATAEIETLSGKRSTLLTANTPYLNADNRFFKPIGSPRIRRN